MIKNNKKDWEKDPYFFLKEKDFTGYTFVFHTKNIDSYITKLMKMVKGKFVVVSGENCINPFEKNIKTYPYLTHAIEATKNKKTILILKDLFTNSLFETIYIFRKISSNKIFDYVVIDDYFNDNLKNEPLNLKLYENVINKLNFSFIYNYESRNSFIFNDQLSLCEFLLNFYNKIDTHTNFKTSIKEVLNIFEDCYENLGICEHLDSDFCKKIKQDFDINMSTKTRAKILFKTKDLF